MKKLVAITAIAVIALSAFAADAPWGARAAAADPEPTIDSMLRYAIEDEYLARAEYAAIMRKFGSVRPFSNIIKAEEQHVAWLRTAFVDERLVLPPDDAAKRVALPSSLEQAYKAGVEAEVDNIAMYDSFLASSLLSRPENASLKSLFTQLRDASKNHLAAFQNQLARH